MGRALTVSLSPYYQKLIRDVCATRGVPVSEGLRHLLNDAAAGRADRNEEIRAQLRAMSAATIQLRRLARLDGAAANLLDRIEAGVDSIGRLAG